MVTESGAGPASTAASIAASGRPPVDVGEIVRREEQQSIRGQQRSEVPEHAADDVLRTVRERLAELIREAAIIPKTRRLTKPTRASKQRRIEGKKVRANIKKNRGKPRHDG